MNEKNERGKERKRQRHRSNCPYRSRMNAATLHTHQKQLCVMVMKSNMININHLLSCHSCVIYFAISVFPCSSISLSRELFILCVCVYSIHICCYTFFCRRRSFCFSFDFLSLSFSFILYLLAGFFLFGWLVHGTHR